MQHPIIPFPDTETQIVDDDPIQSFEGEYDQYDQRGRSPTPVPQKKAAQRSKMRQVSSQDEDDALQCLCGMNVSRTFVYHILQCQILLFMPFYKASCWNSCRMRGWVREVASHLVHGVNNLRFVS